MNLKNDFIDITKKINLNKLAIIFVSFLFVMVGFIVILPKNKGVRLWNKGKYNRYYW